MPRGNGQYRTLAKDCTDWRALIYFLDVVPLSVMNKR